MNARERTMPKWVKLGAVFVLLAHGLIHLIGTVVYLRLGEVQGFAYKTTLLNGSWDLGASGMGVFGALWAVAALGFIVAALTLLMNWRIWRLLLAAVAVFSLVLTGLDSSLAFAGVGLNIVILALVFGSWRSSAQNSRKIHAQRNDSYRS